MALQRSIAGPSVVIPSALDYDDQQFNIVDGDNADVPVGSPVSSMIPTSIYSISTETLAHESNIERHLRVTSRPGSLLSISSSEQPAPPYEVYRSYERIEVATESRPTTPIASRTDYCTPVIDGETAQHDERPTTPPIPLSGEESILVTHYSQVVRTIDQNHVQALANLEQSHQQEVASLRHDIDQVYRREFRAKDREIERIREEAAEREAEHAYSMSQIHHDAEAHVNALEEKYRITIANARHTTEDIWEARWNDRTRIDLEEARRTEAENQLRTERAIAHRDDQWTEKLKMRHPDLLDVWNDILEQPTIDRMAITSPAEHYDNTRATNNNLKGECMKAGRVLASFVDPQQAVSPDQVIPPQILANAKGLAIITLFKLGFLGSGRFGSGVVVARLSDGTWSAPSAVATQGAGFGGQIGFEMTDFVLILNDATAVRTFSQAGALVLGGNVSIAAGPVGRNTEAAGAASLKGVAGVFLYSKTKGLFTDLFLGGSAIVERRDANEKMYNRRITVGQLLGGGVRPPAATEPLMRVLNSKVFARVAQSTNGMYNDISIYDNHHDNVVWEGRAGTGLGEEVAENTLK